MQAPVIQAYLFEGFTLDLKRGCLRELDREIELRPKSFAMLRHLVENAGRLISKEELVEAIWPNVVVTDQSLTRCVSDIRSVLRDGEQRIIKTVSRRGYLFQSPVAVEAQSEAPNNARHEAPLDGGAAFQVTSPQISAAGVHAAGSRPHNLPRQLTSFVRRDAEIAEIEAALESYRLVTLLGPGGVGKTRLALEVGTDLLGHNRDGVWFVELGPIDDAELVGETLCSTVGAQPQGNRSAIENAVAYLREKQALLILDNCEHLIDAATKLAEVLGRACPHLTILATSRERLSLPSEKTYRVQSLGVPPLAEALRAEEAQGYDAVRLFVQRAGAAVEGFSLTDANASAIASICRRLDGIPLAIELAVPQLRMLQPQALEAHLHEPFFMHLKTSRTAPPRHQTLSTVFDWSYALLSESERTLFIRLSVFAGSWTLDAAAAVATGGAVTEDQVFELLSSLADKSLILPDLEAIEPRYKYLQTTRRYASEKLRHSGEDELRRRLAEFMVRRFTEACEAWPTTATQSWLATYEPDLDNLRASLDWAFGSRGDAALAVELTSRSVRIWDELSLLTERRRWFAAALERRDETTPPRTLARLWLGRTSLSSHGDRTNLEPALGAAELFRMAGDHIGLGEALVKAGAALATPEDPAPALPYLQEALDVLKPLGASKHLTVCLRSFAITRYFMRDFDAARPLIAESEAVARNLGDRRGLAAAQIAAAELEFAAGRVDDAIDRTKVMLAGDHINRRQLTLGLGNLAAYLLAAGRVAEARAAALDGLKAACALDWGAAIVRVIEHLALVAALRRKPDIAASLAGFGAAFYAKGTASREFTEIATHERLTAELAKALTQEQLRTLMAEGALWNERRAVEVASGL
jgi:predicted ATPase/DNA-binding winged helix-turn-helix (wHTH) protein